MTDKNNGWNLEQSYLDLPEIFYTKTKPQTVRDPKLVIFNNELESELGLSGLESHVGASIFSGNELPLNSIPLAQAYAGHQFGHFTRLGDGRAILLGEQITLDGSRFDIQLKGGGRTPYSRGGDGRAALGPMLREYIISEAMHALGIPTTRSLAVVTTGEGIVREEILQGAILTRVASSHIRVGTFQFATAFGTLADLKALADYTIERHDPELVDSNNQYLSLLENVIDRQASLIAKWQLVGFIHGVMNTDNMTISGETIDYGPCAFMDTYNRQTVFSSIDEQGRYAYGNQPYIGGWNLTRFAEAVLPLIHENEDKAIQLVQDSLSKYERLFRQYFEDGMREKLGLFNKEDDDSEMINHLLTLMEKYEADYTNTFIALTFDKIEGTIFTEENDCEQWYDKWVSRKKRQKQSSEEVFRLMKNSNPAVIPRNHLVEAALEVAVDNDDYSVMHELLDVLTSPYNHSEEQTNFSEVPKTGIPYQTFCGT